MLATGNKLTAHGGTEPAYAVTMLDDDYIDPLFMADRRVDGGGGDQRARRCRDDDRRDGHTAHALP